MLLPDFRGKISTIAKYDIFWFTILFCGLFLLSYKFLNLWFSPHDATHIYTSTQNTVDLLFDRDTYLMFNKWFYTPLLPISFKLDFVLFGLNPLGYRVHEMLLAFLTGVIGYKLYRLYMPRFESWGSIYLFLFSYPVISIVGWLSMRHYLWGMVFALSSFYLFKKTETKNRFSLFLPSYFLYFFALLCKEVFTPLPAVILLLANGSFRERVLKAAPYFFIFGGYFLLRSFMLGGFGGYIGGNFDMSVIDFARRGISHLNLFSTSVWGMKIVFFMPLLALLFVLNKHTAITLLILLLVVSAPLLFVQSRDEYFAARLLLTQFVFAFFFSSILYNLRTKKCRVLSLIVVSFFFILQIIHAQDAYVHTRSSSENFNKLTHDISDKTREAVNVLVLSGDNIFHNYYYEAFREVTKADCDPLGALTTLTTPKDMLIMGEKEKSAFQFLYLNDKWIDFPREAINSLGPVTNKTLAPPKAKIRQKGQFFTVDIADERDGEIYVGIKRRFSERNVALWSGTFPVKVSFGLGLVRRKEILYLSYCKNEECSQPIILDPDFDGPQQKGADN